MVMLAEFGRLSLREVLAPAMELAEGATLDTAIADRIEEEKEDLKRWPYSRALFLPHLGDSSQREGVAGRSGHGQGAAWQGA